MKDCPHCNMFLRGNYFGRRNTPSGSYIQSWCKVCRWNKWNNDAKVMSWQKDKNGRMLMKEVMVVV